MLSFDTFYNSIKLSSDNFKDYWLRGNAKEPDNFPLEMGIADWFEQFQLYYKENINSFIK